MARRLFTLAYPILGALDKATINAFRAQHDLRNARLVEPHFTMIFGITGVDEGDYLGHVGKIAATTSPIKFHCRYAMLGADNNYDTAYVFLVPDEGYSAISLLHDRLYSGLLISHRRLDLQYVPHITIGTCSDRHEAKALCDALNARGVSIVGKVDALTVAALENDRIEDLCSVRLGDGS
jgi:2'-5' RNA ligase superfamily